MQPDYSFTLCFFVNQNYYNSITIYKISRLRSNVRSKEGPRKGSNEGAKEGPRVGSKEDQKKGPKEVPKQGRS